MTKQDYKRYCHHYRRHDYRAAVAESRGRADLAIFYRRAQLDWSRMLPGDTRRITTCHVVCEGFHMLDRKELRRNALELSLAEVELTPS